jgi:nucleotide-binding universal stress UspA family protein
VAWESSSLGFGSASTIEVHQVLDLAEAPLEVRPLIHRKRQTRKSPTFDACSSISSEVIMSSLRQVLLHVDGTDQSLERLRFAQAIAQPLSAHISALYAVTPWMLLYPGAMEGLGPSAALSDLDAEKRARAKAAFQRAASGMVNVAWSDVELNSPYDFATSALYADLLVLGQRTPPDHSERDVPEDFVPSVMLSSGKPAVIVPSSGTNLTGPIKSVLLAWNASRECARALSAAWPLLTAATEVNVAIFDGASEAESERSIHLERYLRQHDIKPTFYMGLDSSSDAGTALLSLAKTLRVDMLVMGCYGHSRAREWALGGATRTVLNDMTLPVLMAH